MTTKTKSPKSPKALVQQVAAQLTASLPTDYTELLMTLKHEIRTARVRAALAVNRELVLLYWRMGKQILEKETQSGWGAKVVESLADDLKSEFPDMAGLSRRNLRYMKKIAAVYPDEQFLQQAAAKIPWFHNCVIMDKTNTDAEREFYIRKTIENGWSRNVLVLQIESGLFHRQGKLTHNFDKTLPPEQSDLVKEIFKDPYNFEFLNLSEEHSERELEQGLIAQVKKTLLELGAGFAFLGSQYQLEVGGEDFYLDLLFYHVKLHRYIIIELKAGPFKPEYAGKMNFYLSAADDLLRSPGDEPSIGLILCRTKNKVIAEYAVRDINKPFGVSIYELLANLPADLRRNLPAPEEIERRLNLLAEKYPDIKQS
jgi:predicted nuclease of restriction endonuclease-like (RecB) superfamily